jgi:hypothetical protein
MEEALCGVLDLIGSPIAARVRELVGIGAPARKPAHRPELGRVLSTVGTIVPPDKAAAAYETSFRQDLAEHLAVITLRQAPPFSAVLWGRAGSGRDHLMLAAAHPLLKSGRMKQVVRVQSARIACGCIFPGEIDGALMRFLAEATDQKDTLFLMQDLDVCLTGSAVCFSLMANALDQGLRMLATIRYEISMCRLRADDGLARRLAPIHVEELDRAEVTATLQKMAQTSAVAVAPAAIQTAVKLASQQPGGAPAAALGLLGAALTEAQWHGSAQVGPDDVFAQQRNDWPDLAGKE